MEAAGADEVAQPAVAVAQPALHNPWHPVSIRPGGEPHRQQPPPRLLRILQYKVNAVRQFRPSALKGAAPFLSRGIPWPKRSVGAALREAVSDSTRAVR